MKYLIDAYNLLFRSPRDKKKSLEENRRKLIHIINEQASLLHLDITLVFDGEEEGLTAHFDAVAIVYTSSHQTADDYILQQVQQLPYPANITVVSNDSGLIRSCRACRSHTMSLEAFMSTLVKKKKKREKPLPVFQDSTREIARLLAIFEGKLQDD